MSDVFKVSIREQIGTLRARRARAAGKIPAVLYGHGKENVLLAVNAGELDLAIRHGSQLIDLQGDLNESALIKDVQWDAMGMSVLHLDLTRVDKSERVEVSVPVELHGFAPGVQNGGVVETAVHELEISTPVTKIPSAIEVNINALELDQTITVADLEIDSEIKVLAEPDMVVVSCHEPTIVEEPVEGEEGEAGAAEPEVITRAEEGEEGSD